MRGPLPFLICLALTGCTQRLADPLVGPQVALPPDASALAHRGEHVYRTICISCHNLDVRQAGSVGPALAGSSEALIEARLLHSSYPAGYHPQRATHQMPMYPQLATEVQSLSAYLQAFAAPHAGTGASPPPLNGSRIAK